MDFCRPKWMSAWPGYLHSAGVLACAAFAAMSGSSVATATAIGGVVLFRISKFLEHRVARHLGEEETV